MPVRIEKLPGIAYLPFEEKNHFLKSEIKDRFEAEPNPALYGDLVYFENAPASKISGLSEIPYFCRSAMLEPFLLHFNSIGEAANALKEIQRNWAPYQYQFFRRANLIQEKLPYINLKTRKFPVKIPDSPIGLYTLIDENTMIASAKTTSSLTAPLSYAGFIPTVSRSSG